jgi:hypothetical protein
MPTDDNPEAVFAGRLLAQDGGHLIECAIGATMTRLHAYKLDGAFLTRTDDGAWLFVGGVSGPVRPALTDDGPDRDRAAQALHALGVPILSAEDAQATYQAAGKPIHNITAEERERSEAAARARARAAEQAAAPKPRGRPPTGAAMTPAERQAKRRARIEQEQRAEWWAAEQACRDAEQAAVDAQAANDAVWAELAQIAGRLHAAVMAAAAPLDGRPAEPHEDIGALFDLQKEATARKAAAMDAYRAAVNQRRAAWDARKAIERKQDRADRRRAKPARSEHGGSIE